MENFPAWYESTQGPKIASTIMGVIGNVVPILNLVLASKGVNLLPEQINVYVSIGVFVYFSAVAVIGYARAKATLYQKLEGAHQEVRSLRSSLASAQAAGRSQP